MGPPATSPDHLDLRLGACYPTNNTLVCVNVCCDLVRLEWHINSPPEAFQSSPTLSLDFATTTSSTQQLHPYPPTKMIALSPHFASLLVALIASAVGAVPTPASFTTKERHSARIVLDVALPPVDVGVHTNLRARSVVTSRHHEVSLCLVFP